MRGTVSRLNAVLLSLLAALAPCVVAGQALVPSGDAVPGAAKKAALAKDYGKLPLSFEANRGQTDARVRFLSRGNGYSLFLTDSAAVLSLRRPEASPAPGPGSQGTGSRAGLPSRVAPKQPAAFKTDVVRMELAGASRDLHVSGDSQLPGTANYFIGNDPAKWHSAVPTYARVRYGQVYPGVDLVYYGNQSELEYDFVVAPHADPKPIRLRFAGAKKLKLDANGDLEVIAKNGQIAFHKPLVYQEIAGQRKEVEGSFSLISKNSVNFALGAYDHNEEVVIDPTLAYSTYLGGSTGSQATAVAVDSSGNAYITGETGDTDFPDTTGFFQPAKPGSAGTPNAFVAKINASGTVLDFSTYLGGSGGDAGLAITVDSTGDSYVTGYTYSSDFPLKNAYQSTNYGAPNYLSSPFVTKLNASGTALVYSTYIGGSGNIYSVDRGDRGLGIAVNPAGNAYITGTTGSSDFPIAGNPYQSVNRGVDEGSGNAFVTELTASGSGLVFSTFLGGSGVAYKVTSSFVYTRGDGGRGIAVAADGSVFVTGIASSTDFPTTPGVFQASNKAALNNASNAFITKLNPAGSALIYSSYLGGSSTAEPDLTCFKCQNGDGGASVLVDSNGDAYVSGGTYSKDFPTTAGAFQRTNKGVANVFVSKVNSGGTALLYSTLIGGSGTLGDVAYGMALDPTGDVYLSGFTSSTDFPTTVDAYQPSNHAGAHASTNAFLTELNQQGTALIYSTYLGGSGYLVASSSPAAYAGDASYGVALDCSGGAYLTGQAYSADFPVSGGALQASAKSPTSAFVSKFSFSSTSSSTCSMSTSPGGTATTLTSDGNPQSSGIKVTFTAYVQPSSGTVIPTGTVTFTIDGTAGAPVKLDSTGHAAYATSSLSAGSHTITAAYSGDSTYSSSTSASFTETILGPAASISTVSGSGQTAVQGSSFTNPLIVLVKDANGNPLAGVTVNFSGAGLSFSSSTEVTGANGEASITATAEATGSLTASASVAGVSASATFALTGTAVGPLASGDIFNYAGTGAASFSGDGGQATSAALNYPVGTAFDSFGNLYVADYNNNRIRKITPAGVISTYAGNGTPGFSGDNGPAAAAEINGPLGVALDSAGNLYIGDSYNQRVRKVTPQGIISTFAGNGVQGYNGDGIAATSAGLYYPAGMVADNSGNLYIADYFDNRVRKVDPSGMISTVAGNGSPGYQGDNVAATTTELYFPTSVALDSSGNLFIADYYNNRVRKVDTSGIITTIAGTGYGGYNGDGIAGTAAYLYAPNDVATDSTGNVYIGDYGNSRVRKVDTSGMISTVAGTGTGGFSGDGGLAVKAEIHNPQGVAADASGNLFIADANNNRVREVIYAVSPPVFSIAPGTYPSAQTVTLADTTPGAVIYYVIAGSNVVTQYSGPITVSASETIEAIAIANGLPTSPLATAAYVISPVAKCTNTINYASGFTGGGLTLNGGAAISGGALELTDGGSYEARSAFFPTAVPVGNFVTDFTFQLTNAQADGFAFVVQTNSPKALGGGEGGLGYAGIPNSAALKFDLFSNYGEGPSSTGFYLNGAYPAIPAVNLLAKGIDLHSGHIFAVHGVYSAPLVTVTITDTVTQASYTVSDKIAAMAPGGLAFVGFTGGTGRVSATQNILTWSYSSTLPCPVN